MHLHFRNAEFEIFYELNYNTHVRGLLKKAEVMKCIYLGQNFDFLFVVIIFKELILFLVNIYL